MGTVDSIRVVVDLVRNVLGVSVDAEDVDPILDDDSPVDILPLYQSTSTL
jgi:hypothetical protein